MLLKILDRNLKYNIKHQEMGVKGDKFPLQGSRGQRPSWGLGQSPKILKLFLLIQPKNLVVFG